MSFNYRYKNIYLANFGLEKESLRITKNGMIAKTPHPFQNNPQIKMDFAENQVEIVTPPCSSTTELYKTLYSFHKAVTDKIKQNDELLWCLSNPPLFGNEDNIPIALFSNDKEETEFREKLAQKYGRKVMLYSGIHFNFSYSDELISEIAKDKGITSAKDFRKLKDSIYLSVAKNCFKYIWFLVYLTAASPVYDRSFLNGNNKYGGKFCGFASMRNSPHGYQNKTNLFLDLTTAENYVRRIRHLVKTKQLMHVSELYSPVRIKAKKGHSTKAILNDGIEFLELRVFDLNPFSACGFSKDDMDFLHLFMIYMLSLPDFDFNEKEQRIAAENRYSAAKLNPYKAYITLDNRSQFLNTAAKSFANSMTSYFEQMNDKNAVKTLNKVFERVYNPEKRYAAMLIKNKSDYISDGIELTIKQEQI